MAGLTHDFCLTDYLPETSLNEIEERIKKPNKITVTFLGLAEQRINLTPYIDKFVTLLW
jgi:hypothetical protein